MINIVSDKRNLSNLIIYLGSEFLKESWCKPTKLYGATSKKED